MLSARSSAAGLGRLGRFAFTWHEVQPSEALREGAQRLLRAHALRAADALQLAAALAAAEGRPARLEFVSLDDRLSTAAAREGFSLAGLRGA